MLKALTKYGAVTAKARAMRGKMLNENEWRTLREMRGVPEITAFLKKHRGWSDALSKLAPSGDQVFKVVAALRNAVLGDYRRLYMFVSNEDRQYLHHSVYREERRQILAALRRLMSISGHIPYAMPSDFIQKKSPINFPLLHGCDGYAGLLQAVRGSIYEKELLSLPLGEAGLPDYNGASALLDSKYYFVVFSFLKKKYRGMSQGQLMEYIGNEVDMLSLIGILRLQRHFAGSLAGAEDLLIPIHYKLRPQLRKSLISAPSEAAAVSQLQATRWGDYFNGQEPAPLEKQYEKYMSALCAKLIRGAAPSICVAQAYLLLKELECEKLVRVIQAANYGLDPMKVL